MRDKEWLFDSRSAELLLYLLTAWVFLITAGWLFCMWIRSTKKNELVLAGAAGFFGVIFLVMSEPGISGYILHPVSAALAGFLVKLFILLRQCNPCREAPVDDLKIHLDELPAKGYGKRYRAKYYTFQTRVDGKVRLYIDALPQISCDLRKYGIG